MRIFAGLSLQLVVTIVALNGTRRHGHGETSTEFSRYERRGAADLRRQLVEWDAGRDTTA